MNKTHLAKKIAHKREYLSKKGVRLCSFENCTSEGIFWVGDDGPYCHECWARAIAAKKMKFLEWARSIAPASGLPGWLGPESRLLVAAIQRGVPDEHKAYVEYALANTPDARLVLKS